MIIPQGPRLLIKPFTITEKDKVIRAAMAAGIQLPEATKRQQQADCDRGTVLSIGPSVDAVYVSEDIKVGSTIGFAKYGGKFIQDPETEEMLLVINDEDVICQFKE